MEKTIISKIPETERRKANRLAKSAITALCLVCYFFRVGFYDGCPWWNHIVYSFCHTNLFHLAINLMVLWSIRNRIYVTESFVVAVVVSFLPMYISEPTMGLSGFLFGCFGIMWGKTCRWREAFAKVMPFILVTMLVPNVNGLLHLYAFALGYSVGFLLDLFHKGC